MGMGAMVTKTNGDIVKKSMKRKNVLNGLEHHQTPQD